MPELPEVETTRRGIGPLVVGHRVTALKIYDRRLRWPVPETLARTLGGRTIDGLRSVTGEAFGPQLPVVDPDVVEAIIHRPSLELLGFDTG